MLARPWPAAWLLQSASSQWTPYELKVASQHIITLKGSHFEAHGSQHGHSSLSLLAHHPLKLPAERHITSLLTHMSSRWP
jgi:hypothetical protein